MKKPQPEQNPLAPFVVLVGPVAAFVLYLMVLGHPLDAPDLDFISDDPKASETYPLDQIWLAPTPPERPDLAMYRPVYATYLKLNYALWPGKINLFRMSGLFAFVAAALFFSLLVVRLLKDDLARGAAMLLFVVHPMMTEANAWLSAHGVLIALAAWMAGLWVYHVHLSGKLALAPAAVILGVLYFIAFGSCETALLFPLSLLAMDYFARPETDSPQHGSTSVMRLSQIGGTLGGVTLLMLVLRIAALDATFLPDVTVRGMDDASLGSRLALAPSAIALGIFKLFLPLSSSFIHDPTYGVGVLPIWIAIPVLAGFGLVFFAALLQSRTAALGLALATIPLLSLIQILPLNLFFADRLLAFCVPGAALAFGDLIARWIPLAGAPLPLNRIKQARIAAVVLLGVLALISMRRSQVWGRNAGHWAAEAAQSPASPEPLTLQMKALVSSPGETGLDSTTIRRVSEDALRIAKGADADPVYQFLALYHLQVGNAPAMRTLLETILKEERPARYGLYNGLAVAATVFGFGELAQQAMLREHERWPRDFNNLFSLARLSAQLQDWPKALEYASLAVETAPSHMEVLSLVQYGEAALQVPGRESEGVNALTRAMQAEPKLAEPYALMARHYDRTGDFARMESTIENAILNASMGSLAEICSIQVESNARRGRIQEAAQFVTGIAINRNLDIPLQIYTARFLLESGYHDAAEKFYRIALSQTQNHPAAIYGLARIAAERDRRYDVAVNALRALVEADPTNNEAATLLAQVESRLEAMESAPPAPTPDPTTSGESAPLSPIQIN